MFNTSYIEINEKNLLDNLSYVKNIIGDKINLAPVLKGNAYGHGLKEVSSILNKTSLVNTICVYSAEEALKIHQLNLNSLSIIIMGWLENSEIEWAIENDIQYYVFNIERLDKTIEVAKKLGKKASIHIELETGMNRTGFSKRQLNRLINTLNSNEDNLSLEGICTHYAGAESIANFVRVQKQNRVFLKTTAKLKDHGIVPKLYHSSSSAATITYPKMRMDLVRIGILTYGFWPSQETFITHTTKQHLDKDPLKRVISWKTKIMSIKRVKKGEFIGYGNHYFAERDTVIAVIPVGYSHGYARSLSNKGRVLVKGRRVGVIGIVNMNLSIIDITDVENVKLGDEVVLVGTQGKRTLTVASFTQMSSQLNYELLTRLPEDIPRIII